MRMEFVIFHAVHLLKKLLPDCSNSKTISDLRALFPISPTPMDHDYYFSMDHEEGLLDLFDISTTELF